MLVFYVNGANKCFHLAGDLTVQIQKDFLITMLNVTFFYKTVIRFQDSSPSPWTERRGRFYICLAMINSTFSGALITVAPAPITTTPNIRHPFIKHF